MSTATELFLAVACLGGAAMLGCALYGAIREVIDRIGARLARRAAPRIDRVPAEEQWIESWVNGNDMPSRPLDHYEITESQRLIDGAFGKESSR